MALRFNRKTDTGTVRFPAIEKFCRGFRIDRTLPSAGQCGIQLSILLSDEHQLVFTHFIESGVWIELGGSKFYPSMRSRGRVARVGRRDACGNRDNRYRDTTEKGCHHGPTLTILKHD